MISFLYIIKQKIAFESYTNNELALPNFLTNFRRVVMLLKSKSANEVVSQIWW